ncbi:hypothetical protein Peur_035779 [Populus x canadensis]
MVGLSNAGYVALGEASFPTLDKFQKVSIIPLVFLIFYKVSGGAFGVEDSVQAAGPLLALLGFFIFLFIWSIPEALITAEMGNVPRKWWICCLGFDSSGSSFDGGPHLHELQRFKHSGMGYFTPRGVFPASFCVNGTAGDPQTGAIKVERNTTLPKALFYALILDVSAYFFPLLICTGAVPLDQEMWSDGYFSDIAKILGGAWLRSWIQGASALSNTGMFVAEMSSDSFQLLGMAERGMLPEIIGKRIESPAAPRPYKIPVGTVGAILICIPPTLIILVVLALASLKAMAISIIVVIIGLIMQPCLDHAKNKSSKMRMRCYPSLSALHAYQCLKMLMVMVMRPGYLENRTEDTGGNNQQQHEGPWPQGAKCRDGRVGGAPVCDVGLH